MIYIFQLSNCKIMLLSFSVVFSVLLLVFFLFCLFGITYYCWNILVWMPISSVLPDTWCINAVFSCKPNFSLKSIPVCSSHIQNFNKWYMYVLTSLWDVPLDLIFVSLDSYEKVPFSAGMHFIDCLSMHISISNVLIWKTFVRWSKCQAWKSLLCQTWTMIYKTHM